MKTEKKNQTDKNQIDLYGNSSEKATSVFSPGFFADFERGIERSVRRMFPNLPAVFSKNFSPACDVVEDDANYAVTADLPGIKPEDVKVELQGHNLVISGERNEERRDDKNAQHILERHYGSFRRSILLPEDIESDSIKASFQDGVLKVEIPKPAKAASRRIPIQEKKSSGTQIPTGTSTGQRWETEAKNVSDSHH